MSKIPISVCIIAKNEEKYIEECLKRLKPYGFEIVVTDTGSTDRTKEIAEKYADKVLDFEWINDFSAARNFCAKNASNNWILSIDCDEFMNSVDVKVIRILMQKFPRCTGIIRLRNIVIENNTEKYTMEDVVRFYNRNFYSYINPIHEQLTIFDPSKKDKRYENFMMPMEVVHHGYAISPEEMQKKQQRNLDILYKNLENNPDDTYTLFQIGQSQYVLGNYEEAVEYYSRAVDSNPPFEYMYVQILIWAYAQALRRLNRDKEAFDLMEKYADKCKSAKYVFMHAVVCRDNQQPLKALMLFLKAVTLPDVETLGGNYADCYRNIIEIYRQMGENDMADMFVEKYNACLEEKNRIINS